ncbi:NACHT, LRR and PYD domains-containing protein 1 homolog [Mantella aurantiaca]
MDSQHASEKATTERINIKDDKKRSSLVLHRIWFALLGSFALLSGSQSLDIKGELHREVLLPCIVVYKDEFDYSILVVNWQRPENDTIVHSFFYNANQPDHQSSHYRGRTQIFYESLPRGNASLLLKRLTKSDAGMYICYVILKQSSGHLTQYVNLTVEDAPVAEVKTASWILIVALLISALVLVSALTIAVLLVMRRYKYSSRPRDDDDEPLVADIPDPIMKYRMTFRKPIYKDIYKRQFIVEKGNIDTKFQSDVSFGNKQKIINVEDLFTPKNKPLMSKRMLLVGDVGTGKSYFCKWLEQKWARNEMTMYRCIIYVSVKKIETKKEKTSVTKIVENKCKGLSEVLDTPDVLLILDELEDLLYDASVIDTDLLQEKNNNTDLRLNTLIASIIIKKLLPKTDVLIVSRHPLPNSKLPSNYTSTFVLQEFNEDEAYDVYNKAGKIAEKHNTIKDLSNNPAFVIMMCKFNWCPENLQDFTSPYELMISFLQKYLGLNHQEPVEDTIRRLAEESYLDLVKGEQISWSTKEWDNFLKFFSCDSTMKYHCKFLSAMLAALHCVWQPKSEESLYNCLNFWLFGAPKLKKSCPLLSPVAEEHHAKYYHFIRFFMRLLHYSDYKSLCTNTPNMDDKLRKSLRKYLTIILKDRSDRSENFEKLAMVHCVFELHDDYVTEELTSIGDFSLINTPLNSIDIRAFAYCFKDVKLQKLDLRLCALTDQNVEQLKDVIKNSLYVLLSSNRLTSESGTFLEELLQDPQCILEKLALGTNNLGKIGAQTLYAALERNTSLKSLYLYDNNIGDEGTTGMVEHLSKNDSLMELHLCLNAFGAKATENIKSLKAKKTKLKVVVTILEDLELFKYTENKVEGLLNTWRDYNQEWLTKLLEAVQADLQNTDWGMDAELNQERVEELIKQIKNIMDIIRNETSACVEDIKPDAKTADCSDQFV